MKRLGILGGIGPESTIDYYRGLVAAYRQRTGDSSTPPMLINSIDLKRLLDGMLSGDLAGVASYLVEEVERLASGGASVGLIAANSPHVVFDQVRRRSPIPLISIVEAARGAAEALGLRRVGLLGTRVTMQGTFYPEVFARARIAIVVPETAAQEVVHAKYVDELLEGVFLDETRVALLSIVQDLRRAGAEAVFLAGTELPLLLRQSSHDGIALLDTTQIHLDQAVRELWFPT